VSTGQPKNVRKGGIVAFLCRLKAAVSSDTFYEERRQLVYTATANTETAWHSLGQCGSGASESSA